MKRVLCLLLVLFLIPVNIGIISAAEKDYEMRFWGDDFESYNLGDIPAVYDDFYNSSAQKRHFDWSEVSNGIVVSGDASGKFVQMSHEGTDTVTYQLNKYTETSALRGDRDFQINFRVMPKNSEIQVRMQPFGVDGVYTSTVLQITNGKAISAKQQIADVNMNSWIDVSINIYLSKTQNEIFINGKSVYSGVYGNSDISGYRIRFESVITGNNSVLWDDFSLVSILHTESNLKKYEGVHPRLFYSADEFSALRDKAEDFPEDFTEYIKTADAIVSQGPTEYYHDDNNEELWMRAEGNNIRFLSFIYKLTGDPKYKNAATAMVAEAIKYPSWGREQYENKNLACSHMLVGISCYYDWLYHDLTAAERKAAVDIIKERADIIYKGGWWSKSYVMNHLWNSASGCFVSAMAIYDEYEGALLWAHTADRWYRNTFAYLSEDGGCHEGLMYWQYGLKFMEYYISLSKKFFNTDYSAHGYLQNTSQYAHNMFDQNGWKGVRFADFSDTYDIRAIGTLAWLNSLCRDTEQKKINQWFLNKYYNMLTPESRIDETFFNFYDKDGEYLKPDLAGYDTDVHLPDLGLMYMRNDWEGETSAVVAYRCGPVLGEKFQNINLSGYNPGASHVHNDINSPQIIVNGENLLGENIYGGYVTSAHNTLLVNGLGQLGDNGWQESFPQSADADPEILKVEKQQNIVYTVADGTEIYDAESTGLEKFQRHFIFIKPGILIMVDDIETRKGENIPIELRYFPEVQTFASKNGTLYSFKGKKVNYTINPIILSNSAVCKDAVIPVEVRKGRFWDKLLICVESEEDKLIQPTVISWAEKGKTPESVSLEVKDGKYYFKTSSQEILLDIENMSVKINEPVYSGLKVVNCSEGKKAEITVLNDSTKEEKILLAVAGYDEYDNLCGIVTNEITVLKSNESITYKTEPLYLNKATRYRAFAWKKGLTPVICQ